MSKVSCLTKNYFFLSKRNIAKYLQYLWKSSFCQFFSISSVRNFNFTFYNGSYLPSLPLSLTVSKVKCWTNKFCTLSDSFSLSLETYTSQLALYLHLFHDADIPASRILMSSSQKHHQPEIQSFPARNTINQKYNHLGGVRTENYHKKNIHYHHASAHL